LRRARWRGATPDTGGKDGGFRRHWFEGAVAAEHRGAAKGEEEGGLGLQFPFWNSGWQQFCLMGFQCDHAKVSTRMTAK
jgi:hypothetical protein